MRNKPTDFREYFIKYILFFLKLKLKRDLYPDKGKADHKKLGRMAEREASTIPDIIKEYSF